MREGDAETEGDPGCGRRPILVISLVLLLFFLLLFTLPHLLVGLIFFVLLLVIVVVVLPLVLFKQEGGGGSSCERSGPLGRQMRLQHRRARRCAPAHTWSSRGRSGGGVGTSRVRAIRKRGCGVVA